ncbi:putative isomerase YbhE [Rickenella mellea]|uniref:Putative isomerase YbhE n=1 Tax=Rickenella mellea TaxID=50990 RepID=A0A4Y7PN88_9AGAM|nr:putative isomerase YbhE [Rickenella mellea]
MSYRFLVASYTDAIYTIEFDIATKSLKATQKLTVGFHPSWISRHPSDPSLVFTGLEQEDGRLLTLKYANDSGKLEVIGDVSSGGSSPCHILVTEDQLFVANYSSGTVGIFDIQKDSKGSSVAVKPSQAPLQFTGTGPHPRQDGSHPHQVVLYESARIPNHREVLVPDLGTDLVYRITKNDKGIWEKTDEFTFEFDRGGGPRHLVVQDDKLYTLLELSNHMTAHEIASPQEIAEALKHKDEEDYDDEDAKAYHLRSSYPTFLTPHPKADPPQLAAELLSSVVDPDDTFPYSYLYVSNRNNPLPEGDIITVMNIVSPASLVTSLSIIEERPTGLKHLRGMIFFGPGEKYLIAGGQDGGGVKVFEKIRLGKDLKEIAHLPAEGEEGGMRPTGFLCYESK